MQVIQLSNLLSHIIKNPLTHATVVSTSVSHYIFLNMQVVQLNNTLSHITKIHLSCNCKVHISKTHKYLVCSCHHVTQSTNLHSCSNARGILLYIALGIGGMEVELRCASIDSMMMSEGTFLREYQEKKNKSLFSSLWGYKPLYPYG